MRRYPDARKPFAGLLLNKVSMIETPNKQRASISPGPNCSAICASEPVPTMKKTVLMMLLSTPEISDILSTFPVRPFWVMA